MPEPSLSAIVGRSLERTSTTTIAFDHEVHGLESLWTEASALAAAIVAIASPGDRVAVVARNGRCALLAWWASHLAGTILVPINVANRGSILEHQLRDSDPVVLVVEAEFTPTLAEALAETGQQMRLTVIAGGVPGAWVDRGDVLAFDDLVAPGAPGLSGAVARGDLPSHLIYTAGTTGPSKACMVGDAYIDNMAHQMAANLDKRAGETLWTAMPLFHLAAVTHVVGALQVGGSVSLARRFSVSGFWEDIRRSDASIAALMGSMLALVASAPDSESATRSFGQLRVVSGSPVTPELVRTWQQRFGVERVGSGAYGMTEAALITSCGANAYRPGAAGHLNDSFEVQIVDADDRPVPVGEVGEIVCRPRRPGVMFQGYWRDPEKTLSVYRNLWYHTGDYGRLDDDGYLWFVDRGKDYLRRGGENISSYEMEQVFVRHPAVDEVAVHAVPSPLSEDDLKVTAVLARGAVLTPAELFAWCEDKVPRYARPSYIEFREELPRNAVGRILKYELRADGVTASTWQPPAAERSGRA